MVPIARAVSALWQFKLSCVLLIHTARPWSLSRLTAALEYAVVCRCYRDTAEHTVYDLRQ